MIAIVDADLADNGTNFPNLALMKISGYYKSRGEETKLALSEQDAQGCSRAICSKVFTETQEPLWLSLFDNVERGGTGYSLQDAPPLPYEIEHSKPDYELYADYAKQRYEKKTGVAYHGYAKASIGFTTRGCFRQCPFCVNKNKTRVEKWSPIREFLDNERPYIFLLDDNILGFSGWRQIFDELEETGKKISYRQGLDLRLMTPEKAQALSRMKYYRRVGFAFDNIADKKTFIRCAEIYRNHCNKESQAYVLVGFYKSGLEEISDMVERITICRSFDIEPYVMKHKNFQNDQYSNIYTETARFYNQRTYSKIGDLITFIERYGSKRAKQLIEEDASLRRELEKLH